MRPQNSTPLILFLALFLISCNSRTNNTNNKYLSNQKIEKSLGSNSDYKILLWQDYQIEKRTGPDFTVYYLNPIDTSKYLFGNAGFYFGGHPQRIRPDGDKKLLKDSLISGILLDKKVVWTVYDYGNNLSAETILELDGYKVSGFAYGHKYSDIDSLLCVLESLKQKD